jgi:hypothetical protein
MLFPFLLVSVAIGLISLFAVHASAPHEPWWHRLACVVPLSLVAGGALAWAASLG